MPTNAQSQNLCFFSYYLAATRFGIVAIFSMLQELTNINVHRLWNCAFVEVIKVLMCHKAWNEQCQTVLLFKSPLVYLLMDEEPLEGTSLHHQ